MPTHRPRRRPVTVALLALPLLLVLLPGLAAAHADLDEPTPAEGAVIEGQPDEVSGTFTQDVDPGASRLELHDVQGEEIARGGVDPDDPRRMVITPLPELPAGTYEVRWTTRSAEDGEVDRGTWSFEVTALASASATAAPTQATATPPPSPTVASPSAIASSSPESSESPADPETDPAASTTDVLIPIVVLLALVGIGGAYFLRRRGPAR